MASVIEHRLRVLVWMKTEDGEKGRNHPKEPETPPLITEVEQKRDTALSKAERFLQMQERRRTK
ncbi:MAG: DUF5361 domain-containing protein [Dermabacter sp.]|nr:DUF5361 domain-containing protein [Dermabacter sp.]